MSYEQQFYLKKNADIVHSNLYDGDLIFWRYGQRDLERIFAHFGTRVDEGEIHFTPFQVMKLLAAMNEDLAIIVDTFGTFDEGFYNIEENERDYSTDRMMLETYALAKMVWKKFDEKRFDTTFYMNMNDENPVELLAIYAKGISRIVKDMNEDDILVLRAG